MVTEAINVAELLARIPDPEIPEISIIDLGIVRDWHLDADGCRIVLTPTYSGCPAYETIEQDIRAVLTAAGVANIKIEKRYSPAWTTDWLSPQARETLKNIGIAPPQAVMQEEEAPLTFFQRQVRCPRCQSTNTEAKSFFSSTACKAHHRCLNCLEPFDEFKAI